ncbi:hypothetical protein [Succinimonas sp.]|uniref:hypothetical protein n=1 Tax=Succinimonas sp. TaxID=1936151 RepID=UPI00386A9064
MYPDLEAVMKAVLQFTECPRPEPSGNGTQTPERRKLPKTPVFGHKGQEVSFHLHAPEMHGGKIPGCINTEDACFEVLGKVYSALLPELFAAAGLFTDKTMQAQP